MAPTANRAVSTNSAEEIDPKTKVCLRLAERPDIRMVQYGRMLSVIGEDNELMSMVRQRLLDGRGQTQQDGINIQISSCGCRACQLKEFKLFTALIENGRVSAQEPAATSHMCQTLHEVADQLKIEKMHPLIDRLVKNQ